MIWASKHTSRLTRLIVLQNTALRIITKSQCHTAQIFRLGLHVILTLDQIRILQSGEFTFRCILTDLSPHTFAVYFNTGSVASVTSLILTVLDQPQIRDK